MTDFRGSLNGGTTINNFRQKDQGFNPKFNLAYQHDRDDMVYAQAAEGFRLGGTNENIPSAACSAELAANGLPNQPEAFKSDSLWSYELGAKTSLAGGALFVSGAAYQIDWKRPPQSVDLGCGFSTIVNAGAYKVRGIEFDIEFRPAKGWIVRGGGGYNDGRLVGDLLLVGGADGNRVPQTPRTTFNVAIDRDFAFTLAKHPVRSFMHADYRYVGERVTLFPGSTSLTGYYSLPAYGVLNLRTGISWDKVSLELFAENALDKRAVMNKTGFARAFSDIAGVAVYSNRPRTLGMKLGAQF
jgi:outer membrane receptor protein involved in Fe transport